MSMMSLRNGLFSLLFICDFHYKAEDMMNRTRLSREGLEGLDYDTKLGGEGTTQELDQEQCLWLAYARLVLFDPLFIVADNCTGSLDDDRADHFVDVLLSQTSRNRTVIAAFHAKQTYLARKFKRIVVLSHGKIKAEGTHDDLMKTCKHYRALNAMADRESKKDPSPLLREAQDQHIAQFLEKERAMAMTSEEACLEHERTDLAGMPLESQRMQ